MPIEPCLLAALAVIEQDRKILLVRESAAPCRGKWSLPGGRLQPGESILQTAAREIQEETGLTVELTGLLYVDQLANSGADRIRFVFTGKVAGGKLKTAEDEHSMCAGWFSDEGVRRLDHRSPFLQRVIDSYRKNPSAIGIDKFHILTPAEIAGERP